MANKAANQDNILLGEINITYWLNENGEPAMTMSERDPVGESLGLVTILGLLELAKDTAIRTGMAGGDEIHAAE